LVGEAVPQFVCDSWAKGRRLYNMYGPTEATCGATIKRLQPEQPISIGHPNPSSRVYVLDRNRQLMPPGAVGEIFIAGIQVSQGYLGSPMKPAQNFCLIVCFQREKNECIRPGIADTGISTQGKYIV